MTWNPIKAGCKLPKHGEKVLVTDGTIWDVAFFYRGPMDTPWFNTIDLESETITQWSRVEMPRGK
jgi:hypothetical protein